MSPILAANLTYTLRVLAAWWVIRQIKNALDARWPDRNRVNWFVSVFVGAQLTFACDYFIFTGIARL